MASSGKRSNSGKERAIYASLRGSGVPEGEIAMHRFCDTLAEGQAPFEKDLQFFHVAFSKILNGEDPKKALQIERPRGRKANNADWARGLSITREVLTQIETGKRIPGELKRKIARKHRISIPTINRYIQKHRKTASWLNDFLDESPQRTAQYAELKKMFGEGISDLPYEMVDQLADELDSASPSIYNDICSAIKSILEQKAK